MTGRTTTGPKKLKLGVTRNLRTNWTKIHVTLIVRKCFIKIPLHYNIVIQKVKFEMLCAFKKTEKRKKKANFEDKR